jgi:hypothetical protein
MDALLDFRMEVSLDGEALSAAEIKKLLASSEGLALIRGRWIEVQPDKLRRMLDEFKELQRLASADGVSFGEAMRLLSGAHVVDTASGDDADPDWSQVVAGPWLEKTLDALRSPEALSRIKTGAALKATLRPYQDLGLRWLHLLAELGLGACLADDMGLGKTIQVLALLLVLQRERRGAAPKRRTSLLVAPASLLANWASEIERFAPSLKYLIAHPSMMETGELKTLDAQRLSDVDLVITSYGNLLRLPGFSTIPWRLLVLDEAQAIKNPAAKQTRVVKKLDASVRAHRHTGRESPCGLVVDLRLHQPRPARLEQAVHRLHQEPRQAFGQSLRPVASTRTTVHSPASQERQVDHRGLTRQDRAEGLLSSLTQTGGAVRAGGTRARARAARRRRHQAQGDRARDADAHEADLQSSFAMVG